MLRSIITAYLALALAFLLVWLAPRFLPEVNASSGASLRVLHGEEVLTLDREDYLVGVVAAEMPADFEPEALKAQAVAARTYALYCSETGKHPDADVCTDFRCCQAWRSDADMPEVWGERWEEKRRRILDAVRATAGQVLRYEGAAAFTAFHSSSAGFTEDCAAIWNGRPYLVSVYSPESAESVPNYVSTVTLSPLDLRDTLLAVSPEADFTGAPKDWIGEVARDASGRVSRAVIGGVPFSGVKLRELFSLRSTAFSLDWMDGVFQFTVTGFGHGVGMSQYGANVMAAAGADYRAILAHYYPGTELSSL